MKKVLLLYLAAFVVLLTSCSKDDHKVFSSIYGVVRDAATGELIANANVVLSPSGETKITGSDGQFIFNDIDPGQYTVTVQKEGYQTNRKSVNAVISEEIEINIPLTPKSQKND